MGQLKKNGQVCIIDLDLLIHSKGVKARKKYAEGACMDTESNGTFEGAIL